jgi:hypothetical protein
LRPMGKNFGEMPSYRLEAARVNEPRPVSPGLAIR